MRTFPFETETFRGWSRWGLSLNGAGGAPQTDVALMASDATQDPLNDRRVAGKGEIGYEVGNAFVFVPADGGWAVDENGGPKDVVFRSDDSTIRIEQSGPSEIRTSPTGRVTYVTPFVFTQS
jgi:hypothetical protein